jgi:hypothetical protein
MTVPAMFPAMLNRVPIPREERPPLPAFAPVPRKCNRHDGWTPERQKAFIEALADTGCVSRAARMVNMSAESAYQLRRQPGAESFRRAWEAALDFGVARLKDIAFERAIEGQLVPVFVAGKLLGFRRKKNDRLLMFCLRHYGQDSQGRRVTINYFSSRASAGAASTSPAAGGLAAEASTTTVRTTLSGADRSSASTASGDDERAAILSAFEGVELDEEAQAEIQRALEACAERRRALPDEEDPEIPFIAVRPGDIRYLGELESGVEEVPPPFREGELSWEGMGEGGPNEEIERVVAGMEARLAAQSPEEPEAQAEAARREVEAECDKPARLEPPDPDSLPSTGSGDPRLDWSNWETGAYVPPADPPAGGQGDRADDRPPPKKPRKPYRKRQPKPPFVPPKGTAGR